MPFLLTSPSVESGGEMPERHGRDGGNISPQLDWTDPPDGTLSYVLVMEDLDADAQAVRHWGIYDIPADRRHLPPGGSSAVGTEMLPHATNDFGNRQYDGPRPPADGPPHRYRFRLAALNVEKLDVADGEEVGEMWEQARDHIIAEADLVGTFGPPEVPPGD